MNEHGLFTFQGQPRTNSTGDNHHKIKAPHSHDESKPRAPIEPTSEFTAFCRCCASPEPCWGDCQKFCMVRQLPYIQFCVPVESKGTANLAHAYMLAEALCKDQRVHTMVSWPKDLTIFCDSIELFDIPWVRADLTEAAKYIPEQDLAMYYHFKSRHGSSCAHEIKIAASADELAEKDWQAVQEGKWSEVNDSHLLRPRVPGFFLGPGSKTIVFGVNAAKYEGGIEDIESYVLEKVKKLNFVAHFKTESNYTCDEES